MSINTLHKGEDDDYDDDDGDNNNNRETKYYFCSKPYSLLQTLSGVKVILDLLAFCFPC